jgi:hypothetical protein
MVFEKELIIGISIIGKLIERYDGGDSSVSFSEIINAVKNNYHIITDFDEIDEIIDLLNRSCSRHDVLKKVYSSDIRMMFDPIIVSERKEHYLEAIETQLQDELDKLSNIF